MEGAGSTNTCQKNTKRSLGTRLDPGEDGMFLRPRHKSKYTATLKTVQTGVYLNNEREEGYISVKLTQVIYELM